MTSKQVTDLAKMEKQESGLPSHLNKKQNKNKNPKIKKTKQTTPHTKQTNKVNLMIAPAYILESFQGEGTGMELKIARVYRTCTREWRTIERSPGIWRGSPLSIQRVLINAYV